MGKNSFVDYLNSLHNYNAQNENAYGERNVENPYFDDVMVKIGLCDYIHNSLVNEEPHIIILTGHAGDGKTSIMYQVLKDLDISFNTNERISDFTLPTGRKCQCIKDFSELSDSEKLETLSSVIKMPQEGNFVFMVANTGPLINTFGEMFDSPEDKEKAKIQLIDAMDCNDGEIKDIYGIKICVINVATVDNSYFANEFLDNIIQPKLWNECLSCPKKDYCHIYRNINLISDNRKEVFGFIDKHFIWITEYGKRLTIRSMTEQLAYMITGGFSCDEIKPFEEYKYLFSNLFFGYIGTRINEKALNILAIDVANKCEYDNKRLRIDEKLIVGREYAALFNNEVIDIIKNAEVKNVNANVKGWTNFLRRAFFFMNIITDEKIIEQISEDVFSKQFGRFLKLRSGEIKPGKVDANLIADALSMIYVGTPNSENEIPLTLSRESGIAQNVQLITGTIPSRHMRVVPVKTNDTLFNKERERYILHLEVNKTELESVISLPMLDYFEELKNGVISTNIDPQLSHGVESLKAQISSELDDDYSEEIEMIILKNDGNKAVRFEITEDRRLRQV